MSKAKKRSATKTENWVPGWFGSTLTVKPNAQSFHKTLNSRISKAANKNKSDKAMVHADATPERTFGI